MSILSIIDVPYDEIDNVFNVDGWESWTTMAQLVFNKLYDANLPAYGDVIAWNTAFDAAQAITDYENQEFQS